MSAPASHYEQHSAASAVTIADARILRRILVTTGNTSATVTVADGESNTIAVIDAAAPAQFDFDVVVRGGLVVTLDDATTEVTVTYD